MGFIISVGIVVVLAIIIFIIYCGIVSRKCESCKKLGLVQHDKKELSRYNSTKQVTEKVRNKKGEVIRIEEKTIPITKIRYLYTYKCKYCGHKETLEREEEM